MPTDSSDANLVDALVVEYLDRKQRGEAPSIEEYCERHPQHVDEIRSLLRTVDRAEADFVVGNSTASVSRQLDPEPELEQLAGYRIIREIGRGGMGRVYEAEHEALGRRAALKVLPRSASQETQAVLRFIREGKAIAQMHHSNIVPLYEVGEDQGRFFLAMQLIDGRSLDQVIRDVASIRIDVSGTGSDYDSKIAQLFPNHTSTTSAARAATSSVTSGSHSFRNRYFRQIARIGTEAAEALAYAHQRGFVHRDVKPSNLLLDETGVTWLTDFGLAKSENDDLTNTGEFVGTLRYMAPERFKGHCDERSDIYALGLTLYEFLALRPAFDSSDRLSTISRITNEDPPRLRGINHEIPRDLETVIMKAIDKEPKSRYQSARALAEDLGNFIHDLPIKARRHSLRERFLRWSRRHQGVAAALCLAITSLILLATFSSFSALKQSALRAESESRGRQLAARGEELEAQRKEQQKQAVILKEQSDELQRSLYYAQMNLASAAAEKAAGVKTIKAKLQSTHPDVIGKDLRGWEWHYLLGLVNQETLAWEEGGWTWEVSYSPDGTKIVYAINGFGIVVHSADRREIIRVIRTNGAHNAQWSPDGKSIASSDYVGNIYIWDAETYEERHRMRADEHIGVTGLCWSPDSSRLASSVPRRKNIVIWNADTGQSERTLKTPNDCAQIAWSPLDNIIAARMSVPHEGVSTWLYNTESGDILKKLRSPDKAGIGGVCWNEDGTRLVTSTPVHVWDWQAEKIIAKGPKADRAVVAWRPGHQQIAFTSMSGITLWDVDSKQVVREFYGQAAVESLSWSPAGNQFASCGLDMTVRFWDTNARAPLQETIGDGRNDNLAWDASGRYLIGNSAKNFANVWDTKKHSVTTRLFADNKDLESNRLWTVAVNQQDDRMAFGGTNKHVRVWDRSTDTVEIYEGIVGETKALAWSSDGRLAAICWPPHYDPETSSAGTKTANNLVIWDAGGKLIGGPKPTHGGFGMGLSWHPDGTTIATAASDSVIRIWESDTLDLQLEVPMPNTFFENSELRYSPDGRRLASANQDGIFVWDAESGEMLGRFDEIRKNFRTLDWSPDGRMLAAGSYDSTSVWEVEHGRLAIKFNIGVQRVRWAPDGVRLGLSAGNKLMILDASRGYELEGTVRPGQLPVVAEAPSISPDAKKQTGPTKNEPPTAARVLMSGDWTWSEPVKLPESVNSEHDEYEPFLTDDGLQLYFNSDRPGGHGGFDLYVCRRDSVEDDWGPATNLGSSINSAANDEAPHVTCDGTHLYFNSNRDGSNDLLVAAWDLASEDWKVTERFPSRFNSINSDGEPTLSRDGRTLIFVSTRAQKFELFASRRSSINGKWSSPKSLGGKLNSADWQGSPCILNDETGSVLIFHSSSGPMIAYRESADTSFTVAERLPDTSVLGSVFSPFLWKDGKTLFYRRPDRETGTFDLWMSVRVKQ